MSVDKLLFYTCSALITVGIIFSLSLTSYTVLHYDYDHIHFFIRQFFVGVGGIFLMWFLSHLNPDKAVGKICMTLFVVMFLLMIFMPFFPSSFVTGAGGARRWIRLGSFSVSPVEFFKIGFIYFLAWSFARKIDASKKKSFMREFSILAPHITLFLLVIYVIATFQNDLGQIVVLGAVLLMMVFYAGTSLKFLSSGILILLTAVLIIAVTSQHRVARFFSWWGSIQNLVLSLLPPQWAEVLRVKDTPVPYQVNHSLNAINNGGFFGEGLGLGTFKLGFLSEVHTDFVLAGIIEEIGIVGIFIVVCLIYLMLFRIFKIASRAQNKVYYLFTLGIGFMFFFSFIINSYGITSIIPVKGLAVPFISYGGSQLLAACVAIGLVLMISKRSKLG